MEKYSVRGVYCSAPFIVGASPHTTTSIWQLYEVRHPSLSTVRAPLLLRVLVVDAVPFRELLTETFSAASTWESRSD